MRTIDVNKERFEEVEIKGRRGLFTDLRVDKSTVPEGVSCYELRHGDDDSYPATLELSVRTNYFGAVLMTDKIELGQEGYKPLEYDDFGFTGEEFTMLEYRANYLEKPNCFLSGTDLIKFMGESDTSFELTEAEADKLLDYISRHNYLLGEKEGKLLQGDLCYAKEEARWAETSIDDVIRQVSLWNFGLLQEAEEAMSNPKDGIDFSNQKSRLDALREDEKVLDALFDCTKYGKELDELARKMAEKFIQDLQSPERSDGAIQRMAEGITAGKDLLPDVSPALKQNKGRAR